MCLWVGRRGEKVFKIVAGLCQRLLRQALSSSRYSSTMAVDIYILVHSVCAGFNSECYMYNFMPVYFRVCVYWTVIWGVSGLVTCGHGVLRVVTLIMSTYCVLVCMNGLLCGCVMQSMGMLLYGQSSGDNPIGLWPGHSFGSFKLTTSGLLNKGWDQSHVESGKYTYMSVFFVIV